MRLHNKGVAAGLAAAMSTAAVGMLAATSPVVASAAAPPKVVTVTLGGGKIALGSTSIPAGNVVFAVKSTKGDHTMQVLQLHAGYSQNQAQHDINAAWRLSVGLLHQRTDRHISTQVNALTNSAGSYTSSLATG